MLLNIHLANMAENVDEGRNRSLKDSRSFDRKNDLKCIWLLYKICSDYVDSGHCYIGRKWTKGNMSNRSNHTPQKITEYFKVDTSDNSYVAHPYTICTQCYNVMMTCNLNLHSDVHVINRNNSQAMNEKWVPFLYGDTVRNCPSCVMYITQQSERRPKNITNSIQFVRWGCISQHECRYPCDRHKKIFIVRMHQCTISEWHFSNMQVHTPIAPCIFNTMLSYVLHPMYEYTLQSENIPICAIPYLPKKTAYQNVCCPNLQIISTIRDMPVTCNECEKTDSLELMSKHQCHQTCFQTHWITKTNYHMDPMPDQRPISQTMEMCIENTSSNVNQSQSQSQCQKPT